MQGEYCKNCVNLRGYSNTGYWCGIDKADIEDVYDSCKCYEEEE